MSRTQLTARLDWLSRVHLAALSAGRPELAGRVRRHLSAVAGQLRGSKPAPLASR